MVLTLDTDLLATWLDNELSGDGLPVGTLRLVRHDGTIVWDCETGEVRTHRPVEENSWKATYNWSPPLFSWPSLSWQYDYGHRPM